jgi:hypothetical protein
MITFKPGDRIRNVSDPDGNVPYGCTTKVVEFSGRFVKTQDDDGSTRYRVARHYQLVPPPRVPAKPTPFDATKLRKGDKVLVVSTVLEDGVDEDGELFIQPGPYATLSQIIGYAPGYVPAPVEEPLAVGDKVTADTLPVGPLCIQKIDKEGGLALLYLWNTPHHEFFAVCPLGELKRVPE